MSNFRNSLRMIRKHPLSSAVIVGAIAVLVAVAGLFYGAIEGERVKLTPFEDADRMVIHKRLPKNW